MFTRNAYVVYDVFLTLLQMLCHQNYMESIFWVSELFYSGYTDELLAFLKDTYTHLYTHTQSDETNTYFESLMNQNPVNIKQIYTIVQSMCRLTCCYECFLYEKSILAHTYEVPICLKPKELEKIHYIANFNKPYIDKYKQMDWMPSVHTKYKPTIYSRFIVQELKNTFIIRYMHDLVLPSYFKKLLLTRQWVHHVWNVPVWKERLERYQASYNEDKQEVVFSDPSFEQEFYKKYAIETLDLSYFDIDETIHPFVQPLPANALNEHSPLPLTKPPLSKPKKILKKIVKRPEATQRDLK